MEKEICEVRKRISDGWDAYDTFRRVVWPHLSSQGVSWEELLRVDSRVSPFVEWDKRVTKYAVLTSRYRYLVSPHLHTGSGVTALNNRLRSVGALVVYRTLDEHLGAAEVAVDAALRAEYSSYIDEKKALERARLLVDADLALELGPWAGTTFQ